ncbi:hypothetical protein [Allochromatium palmeri]|uniref:Uncharacterized protein n=1 Tax=Allochromatium palmeri TaxID=231048 RepID=A0A6N8EHX8_9GAMM|nr:hypothetical protein [Allochromatium palmeri]MTW23221.1 hypothetical protein [Allochromatium palmeri]
MDSYEAALLAAAVAAGLATLCSIGLGTPRERLSGVECLSIDDSDGSNVTLNPK